MDKRQNAHLPVAVEKTNNVGVTSLYGNYSMYANRNGDIFSFGKNLKGRLGQGTADEEVRTPRQIAGLKNIVKISTGNMHALCLD